ncbi:MAG: hypothetical protein ACXWQ5_00245 [Ktedonobacterales bacterium]
MAGIYQRSSNVGDYSYFHISTAQTATPIGRAVGTTATTVTAGGGAATTVTVSAGGAANIEVGMMLTICGGTGAQEDVRVTAVNAAGNTFTANFANAHSGTYTVASRRSTALGELIIGNAGSGVTMTIYDGHPNANYSKVISVITPVSTRGDYPFACIAQYGLFVTLAGTTPGDYTIQYIDVVAQ